MQPLLLSASTLVTCLGTGMTTTLEALRNSRSGLESRRFETAGLDAWIGEVEGLDDAAIGGALARFDCRNNRLAERALAADGFAEAVASAVARHGASRIGVFVGTSTSGILQTEIAYRHRGPDGALPASFHYANTHNSFSVADYTRRQSRISARLPLPEIAAHLKQPAAHPALYVSSVNVDTAGVPIEYACTWFAGDRVTLTVDHDHVA